MSIARMGYVGYVRWEPSTGNPINVRVTSSDVKLSQEISYPEVVDGKVDQTVWQLGPQIVGGNVAFPLIHELAPTGIVEGTGIACGSATDNSGSLAQRLWSFATKRDRYGRMDPSSVFDCAIRYADNIGYRYKGCMVNTMQFSLNESNPVNVTCDIIGGAGNPVNLREDLQAGTGGYTTGNEDNISLLAPARIVTWNDSGVSVYADSGSSNNFELLIKQGEIREFTCQINNNIERIYALNGRLSPIDIVAKKREVSGTLKTLGGQYKLSQYTLANQSRFTSNASIAFGYRLGAGANYYWATGLYGVVFEIEEVALSNALFETTTKWRALGDCDNQHLATKLGESVNALADGGLPRPTSTNYGTQSAPDYPTFDTYSVNNP